MIFYYTIHVSINQINNIRDIRKAGLFRLYNNLYFVKGNANIIYYRGWNLCLKKMWLLSWVKAPFVSRHYWDTRSSSMCHLLFHQVMFHGKTHYIRGHKTVTKVNRSWIFFLNNKPLHPFHGFIIEAMSNCSQNRNY